LKCANRILSSRMGYPLRVPSRGGVTNLCFCPSNSILSGIFLSKCFSFSIVLPHLYLLIDVLLNCFFRKLYIWRSIHCIYISPDPDNPPVAVVLIWTPPSPSLLPLRFFNVLNILSCIWENISKISNFDNDIL